MPRVVCPSCGKAGSVPDVAAGKRIKCPACGERFVPGESRSMIVLGPGETVLEATDLTYLGPAPPPAPVVPPVYVAVNVPPPPVPARPETKTCPFCGEAILIEAVKCKHCGELLDPALRAAAAVQRREYEPLPPHPPSYYAPPQQVIQQRIVVKTGRGYHVPHLLHLLLTLLTFGLWLPIWIIHALLNSGGDRD
jgi:hypothetical protein